MVDFMNTSVYMNPTKPYLDTKTKTKWLKALRSRKFKQGKTYLKTDDGKYCCLGVLCEVMSIPMGSAQTYLSAEDASKIFHCDFKVSQSLQVRLGEKNDGDETSHQRFYEIARWIERNL